MVPGLRESTISFCQVGSEVRRFVAKLGQDIRKNGQRVPKYFRMILNETAELTTGNSGGEGNLPRETLMLAMPREVGDLWETVSGKVHAVDFLDILVRHTPSWLHLENR